MVSLVFCPVIAQSDNHNDADVGISDNPEQNVQIELNQNGDIAVSDGKTESDTVSVNDQLFDFVAQALEELEQMRKQVATLDAQTDHHEALLRLICSDQSYQSQIPDCTPSFQNPDLNVKIEKLENQLAALQAKLTDWETRPVDPEPTPAPEPPAPEPEPAPVPVEPFVVARDSGGFPHYPSLQELLNEDSLFSFPANSLLPDIECSKAGEWLIDKVEDRIDDAFFALSASRTPLICKLSADNWITVTARQSDRAHVIQKGNAR